MTRMLRSGRTWRCLGAGLALALVFSAYLNPHLLLALGNTVWACF